MHAVLVAKETLQEKVIGRAMHREDVEGGSAPIVSRGLDLCRRRREEGRLPATHLESADALALELPLRYHRLQSARGPVL
eukprot:SAG11_NODE_1782_length_4261_cov_2.796732_3_plen_80_part_00